MVVDPFKSSWWQSFQYTKAVYSHWGGALIATTIPAALFGWIATFYTPVNADIPTQAIYPTIGGLIGLLVGFIGISIITVCIAPYHQRNELRKTVRESQKPDNNKIIREQLADYWLEGFQFLPHCINVNKPFPGQQIDEWMRRVGGYINEKLGKDFYTTFHTITITNSNGIATPPPERAASFSILYNGLNHLQEFMAELRARSTSQSL